MKDKYTKKQKDILNEITTFCENECSERECCIEEDCVLYRIEQLVIKGRKKNDRKIQTE